MGVGVLVLVVAMAGRAMGVGIRRLWVVCILGAKVAISIIGSIIGIVRAVGADRGGLMGVGAKVRKRSMIEEIDNADEV